MGWGWVGWDYGGSMAQRGQAATLLFEVWACPWALPMSAAVSFARQLHYAACAPQVSTL